MQKLKELRIQNEIVMIRYLKIVARVPKMHVNILVENQRIKELLIGKDSVLTNLGYERHQLQNDQK
jgi:hypothetical protein